MKRHGILLSLILALAMVFASGALMADDKDAKDKRHPSYSLIGRDAPPADSPLNPNFASGAGSEARLPEKSFWRGGYIPERMVGLAVGDIDRDGKNEVVYATLRNIYVTRFATNSLQTLAQFSINNKGARNLSVDLLDIDGDGRLEIIASCQDDATGQAASRILSFDGKNLTPLVENVPWYLRVIASPGGDFLVGQRSSTSRSAFYGSKIMKMSFDGTTVKSGDRVSVPDTAINLYNFTIGNLGSNRSALTAAIKFPSEHLFLYEGGGKAWESHEEYGGTMNFIEPYNTGGNLEVTRNNKKEFLPARIIIADVDGDGQNELVVAKNYRGGVSFMGNLRAFSTGSMEVFKYINMSLSPIASFRMPGPAVDYQLADFNNNGAPDLICAVVMEQGSGILEEARSIIIAYEFSK